AGQVVMEGYLNLRIQPWVRRIITRIIAIVPALITVIYFGERATGDLLVLSQVVLSLQLGFAIIPLIHFVRDKQKMGSFAISIWTKLASWAIALVIVTLNAKLVFDEILNWLQNSQNPIFIWVFVVPIALGALVLLLYILIKPLLRSKLPEANLVPHIREVILDKKPEMIHYKRIAIALDFSTVDDKSVASALQLSANQASYTLIHIVESAGALTYGSNIADFETSSDRNYLRDYQNKLTDLGYEVQIRLGFGNPKKKIPEIVNMGNYDILILGSHGHKFFKDILFGTTVDTVRHKIDIPVLIVRDN
ncbi:MAG: divalent metal cation transporter, partial [Flavobacteriaceae bacterium]